MDFVLLVAGLALTWAFGASLLHAIDPETRAGGAAWRWGCGWFAGIFLVTVWMRVLSAAGVPFGVAAVGGPLLLATIALSWLAARRGALSTANLRASARAFAGDALPRWQRVLWIALLAWLALRFALLLSEVLVRPLFPWDAWTQWATKARVWFDRRAIVPFLASPEWLAAGTPLVWFDSAPHYPATVPLMQTWSALLIGRFDDALVNLPWWCTGVALGLALFGALRALRFEPLAALIGTWLVLSLPLLDAHVALAGYADLAMASYFTLAALAALRCIEGRRWQDGVLAVLLAIACLTVKNPGKAWLVTLLPALAVAWNARIGLRAAGFAFAAFALAVAVVSQMQITVMGYALQPRFALSWSALADAYLLFGNWHLLGYAAVAVCVLARRRLLAPGVAPLTVLVAGGMAFLFFGFAFTMAAAWVEDQSTVNRATLHLAPLIAVWVMVAFRAWRESLAAPAPAPVQAGA